MRNHRERLDELANQTPPSRWVRRFPQHSSSRRSFHHQLNGLGIKVIYRMSRSRKEATTVDPAERLAELVDLRSLTSQLTRHEAEIAKSLGTRS